MLFFSFWFLAGLVAAYPFHVTIRRLPVDKVVSFMGYLLLVAAIIYLGFALLWGDAFWFLVEACGVPFYGVFFWLALNRSPYWLALGWLLHPLWDAALHLLGPGHEVAPSWYAIGCLSFDLAIAVSLSSRFFSHTRKPDLSKPAGIHK